MAAKLTGLTHRIAIQLHLVAESCTICSSRSRRPIRLLFDTPSYTIAVLCFPRNAIHAILTWWSRVTAACTTWWGFLM